MGNHVQGSWCGKRACAIVVAAVAALYSLPGSAISFDWDIGDGVNGSLNTALTFGAAWRMEERASHLIGFGNLDPDVCEVRICQGVWQGDTQPNEQRLNVPGAFSNNGDDGNLNYDKYDITQAPFKILQDLGLSYGDFGFFGRWNAFYDVVNYDFREFHPNRADNNTPATGPTIYQAGARDGIEDVLGVPISIPLPVGEPLGTPTINRGEVMRPKRRDDETLEQIGADIDLFDAYVYGDFEVFDRFLRLQLGRQSVNWGESTILAINSLNQINPPNVNNLFRVGLDLAEVFTPVGLLYGAIGLTESTNIEVFYQYEWEPVEIPAPGSFLSFLDVGTNNAKDSLTLGFGGPFEDQRTERGHPGDNVLSTITNTTGRLFKLPDNEPDDGGQYGLALRYYADWLNQGTELAFYYMRYHSRLPYLSAFSTDPSCARREGNPDGIDAFDTVTFGQACPDLPLQYQLTGQPTTNATSDAIPFDTVRVQLEYPEDIDLYGVSFNTVFGDLAIQGEVAYRPDLPIQVDAEDVIFTAFQPVLGRCHGSGGSTPCVGTTTSGPNTFSLTAPIGGDYTGSARAFPSYLTAFRGFEHEEVPANTYIRGWENFESYQFNIGGTYIYKPPGPVMKLTGGMDQLIFFFEIGAQYVPDITGPCELPLEAPGTFTHAGPGADGTGTPEGGGRVCFPEGSSVENRNADGSDGLRFNPTQQLKGFPDDFSAGYRLIIIPRWESFLPGFSLQPLIIFGDDVKGTSPGPGESFLEGRQTIIANFEFRYKNNWSVTPGYTWFRGAKPFNQISDRDYASLFVKYAF